VFVGKSEGKKLVGKSKLRREDNTEIVMKETV
jgi:hypothetical protein